jgi:hypothetical protein
MSVPLPAGEGAARPSRLAVFAVAGVDCAVAGRVVRSLPVPRPLPAAIRHGEAEFPVVDLAAALGAATPAEAERLLFLVEEGAVRRALVIERLVGAESFDLESVLPVPALYPEAERRRFHGLLPRAAGSLVVLRRPAGLPASGGEG